MAAPISPSQINQETPKTPEAENVTPPSTPPTSSEGWYPIIFTNATKTALSSPPLKKYKWDSEASKNETSFATFFVKYGGFSSDSSGKYAVTSHSGSYIKSAKPMPSTLRKTKEILPFKAESLPLSEEGSSFPFAVSQYVDIKGYYEIDLDLRERCIKQPPQKASCGPCATLMVLSHLADHQSELKIDDSFWKWYVSATLISQEAVMQAFATHTNLSALGYQAKGIYYNNQESVDWMRKKYNASTIEYVAIDNHKEDLLSKIKCIQEKVSMPLIVSITNRKIHGHWIVIDRIVEEGVFIRDPFTGKGYKLPLEELYENWNDEYDEDDNDEVKIIYLDRIELNRTPVLEG